MNLVDYGWSLIRHCKTLPPALIPLMSYSVSLVSVECLPELYIYLLDNIVLGQIQGDFLLCRVVSWHFTLTV